MAKEEELKKFELKVSVDCCDGCKKKVLKALSIKGVLKTEIHPTLPRVTVTGNVDGQTLIKKLAKCGKMAELLSGEVKREDKANGKEVSGIEKAQEENCKPKLGGEQKKSVDKCNQTEGNGNGDKQGKCSDGTENKNLEGSSASKAKNSLAPTTTTTVAAPIREDLPQLNYMVNQAAHHAILSQPIHPQAYYPTESYMVPMTYHMQGSCLAPVPPCCMREHCYYRHQAQQLPPRLTEYFNDDNTSGCHIM